MSTSWRYNSSMVNKQENSGMDKEPLRYRVIFSWYDGGGSSKLSLHDRTLEEAMEVAKSFGYKESRWYKPSTWSNHFLYWVEDK